MKLIKKTLKKKNKWYGVFLCPNCLEEKEFRIDTKAKQCLDCKNKAQIKNHHNKDDRLYSIYNNMKQRCTNKKNHRYIYYGKKNIKINFTSYIDFKEWALINGYKNNLTIERKDINKNYSKENCEWITREENTKRSNYRSNYKNNKGIKISEDEASEICEAYATGIFTQKEISIYFNVTRPTITNIITKGNKI